MVWHGNVMMFCQDLHGYGTIKNVSGSDRYGLYRLLVFSGCKIAGPGPRGRGKIGRVMMVTDQGFGFFSANT